MENKAVLLGIYGDDNRVCNSAWQSTGHSITMEELEEYPLEERSERLFIETMKTKKKSPRDLIMMLGKLGHHCYDDQTEILTRKGWKLFKDLVDDDLVCAVDPKTLESKFEKPKQIYRSSFKGLMYKIEHNKVDLLVTPGHRMVVSDRKSNRWTDFYFNEIENIIDKQQKIPNSVNILNDIELDENFAKLIGFFVGDGSVGQRCRNVVNFNLKKQRKINYLMDLGFNVERKSCYKVYLEDVGKRFKKICYTPGGHKKLPDEYLTFSKDTLLNILDGLRNSDGENVKDWDNFEYTTNSEILANQIITLVSLVGLNYSKFKFRKKYFRIKITPNRFPVLNNYTYESGNLVKKKNITEEFYEGEVSCVTVSTGAVLVRRNGKIVVSSNTPFEKVVLDFQVISDIPTHYEHLKHRIGVSINAESSRYKELQDKWLIPEDWPPEYQEKLNNMMIENHKMYHQFCTELTPILGRKRAKESSRFIFPCGKQLTYDIMFNLRSFSHYIKLRADSAAQYEIQQIAKSMLKQVYEQHVCDWSLEALGLLEYLELDV